MLLVFTGLLMSVAGYSAPAPQAERILATLAADGFENLSVEEEPGGDTIRILFENRRYRWEVDGLGVVLALAARNWDGRVVAIPLLTGLPMVRIEVDSADYRAFLQGDLDEAGIFSRMTIAPCKMEAPTLLHNASLGRLDVAFAPGLRVNLATPAPPGVFTGAEIRANTTASMNLWRGLAVEGTYVYPLSDSRPAFSRAAATWNSRLGRAGYLQIQGGRLANQLDGVAANASYLSDSGQHRLALTVAQVGRPGSDRSTGYQVLYSWRPETVDVAATLSGGVYLQGDRGCSVSLYNGFAENSIEFFYTTTTLSRTTGVILTTPLGRPRWPKPGAVRVRLRDTFGFSYTDDKPRPLDGGVAAPFNDRYQTAIRRWNRAYLRAYARQLREAGRRWGQPSAEIDANRGGCPTPPLVARGERHPEVGKVDGRGTPPGEGEKSP